tara:strand:+ start:423 stop:1262 length:840 start_codon:yes stop_codon:yes gene_type:complete
MSDRDVKIINGQFAASMVGPTEPFPRRFLNDVLGEDLDDVVAEITAKYFGPEVSVPVTPVQGWVLRVKKNAPLEPLGPRYEASKGTEEIDETCTKVWVHVWSKDKGKAVPMNWVHPETWNEEQLTDLHYIYEAANKDIDKIVPKMGDVVDVMYPWAGNNGWKSRVGVYLGISGTGMPLTIRPTKEFFKRKEKCDALRKTVPEKKEEEKPSPGLGTELLERGSAGDHVAVLQRFLGIDDDGLFGRKTRRAVKHYQRANSLVVDGIVGDKTRAKINETLEK